LFILRVSSVHVLHTGLGGLEASICHVALHSHGHIGFLTTFQKFINYSRGN